LRLWKHVKTVDIVGGDPDHQSDGMRWRADLDRDHTLLRPHSHRGQDTGTERDSASSRCPQLVSADGQRQQRQNDEEKYDRDDGLRHRDAV